MKLHGTAAILPGGHLGIGGLDVVDLAREYGTPLWVIDEEHLRRNCRTFRKAFGPELFPSGAEVVYASKALQTQAVCRIIDSEGLSLDVVSGGELHAALGVGYPAEKVYFHGNNKSAAEIAQGLEAGVGRFMVDNLREIELIEQALGLGPASGRPARRPAKRGARRAEVILRVTPDVEAGNHDHVKTAMIDSKFGLALSTGQALDAIETILASPVLGLKGLHCHLGSQIFEVEPFVRAAELILDFAAEVRDKTGWAPEELSLGGGFGVRYANGDMPLSASAFAEAIARTLARKTAEHGLPVPKLLIEPGRAICATAGWTVYSVGNVKEIPGVRTYVVVDGGMSDNPRPALYQAKHEACLANRAAEANTLTVTVAGRCCESGDVLIRDLALPAPETGDILAISCTGAYNYTMSMNYNRLPRPAMVLVNQGQADLILRRETYEDLELHDVVPERLGGRAAVRERKRTTA